MSRGFFESDDRLIKTVLPLFIVTGASGAGKSTIIEPLQHILTECGIFFSHVPRKQLVTFRHLKHIISREDNMLSFHELYETYAQDVYRFAYWLAGNAADAEDITSETFIRIWTKISSIQTETFKAYLLQTARNIYLEWLRKQRRQTDLDDIYPDPEPGPEQLAEDHDELEKIQRLLQAIPEIDRAAFILRVQHDLPYAEIARVLQLSETAAKVKVHRVRRKLITDRLSKEVA